MAKAFDSIAKGLREAIDLNTGKLVAEESHCEEEIEPYKKTNLYVSSDLMLKRLDESLAKARIKQTVQGR